MSNLVIMKLLFTLFNLLFLAAAVYLGHSGYQKISLDQKFDKPEISKPTKKAVSSKSYGFLAKPVDITSLAVTVELALQMHNSNKNLALKHRHYHSPHEL